MGGGHVILNIKKIAKLGTFSKEETKVIHLIISKDKDPSTAILKPAEVRYITWNSYLCILT